MDAMPVITDPLIADLDDEQLINARANA